MKVVLIGVGNMGSAMVKAWLRGSVVASSDLTLFDTDPAKMESSEHSFDKEQINLRISKADVIVLAIKPQDLVKAAEHLRNHISAESTILSILAGVSLERLSKCFPENKKIVRAMPNIAARICQAITGYVSSGEIDQKGLEYAQRLLSALGPLQKLEKEDLMDAWSAVAGSGPGFLFEWMQNFISAAMKQGFSAEVAEKIVKQTFYGTLLLAKDSKIGINELKDSVVSKGGITAAGLQVMQSRNLPEIVEEVVAATVRRGKELNS